LGLGSEIVFPSASAIGYHRFYGIRQSAETVRRELRDVRFPDESRCGKTAKRDCVSVCHFPANTFSRLCHIELRHLPHLVRHPLQSGGVLHPFGEKLCRCYLPGESVDLRILEHRDVEICRFFRLIIEPQHRSNSLHASRCAQRDAMQRCDAARALDWHLKNRRLIQAPLQLTRGSLHSDIHHKRLMMQS
jgi:hypothetical protein